MKIFVRVKPGSKKRAVVKRDETHFSVSVKEPATRGLANAATVKLLAEHFSVPPTAIRIITGHATWNKVVAIQAR